MIGQSVINVKSGGRTRLSTLIAGVALLFMVVFLSDWVSRITMAALVAVMIMVCIGTFSWDSLRNLKRYPLSTNIVMVVTVAVVVGQVFLSAADKFSAAFDLKETLRKVCIDLTHTHFWDITAVAALVDRFGVHDKPGGIERLLEH